MSQNVKKTPVATVGAGKLSAHIWKRGDARNGWRLRYSLFRQNPKSGHVTQLYRPTDVTDLAKLCHVLAIVLLDDGCLANRERQELRQVADLLKTVTDVLDESRDPQ